jgi:uncharacterized protein YjbK
MQSTKKRYHSICEQTNFVLDTTRFHLIREHLCARLLRFRLVDELHEDSLVLEDVTLRFLV